MTDLTCINPILLLGEKVRDRGGQGIGSCLACHEFEPSTTKDPPYRGVMYFKSVESLNVLPSEGFKYVEAQALHFTVVLKLGELEPVQVVPDRPVPRHLTEVQPKAFAATLNSSQATSPLRRTVEGDEKREALILPGCSPSKLRWN
ncbi:hypothetical protein TNCV_4759151 [Trichonephila clavipes]|nr:hypothetical protein TNCV_4759151 [Trichonephila clavipes]